MKQGKQRLIFVTGKGGVGKSSVAAAIAWREARAGRKVCLIELGGQSFYESFFETRGISYEPIEVIPDVHVALLTPEDCLKEYVVHFIKLPKLYDLLFQNRVTRSFLNAAPALAEISLLGKLTSDIRGVILSDYEVYVVDAFSTGHAMALFRAPDGLAQAFRTGPIHEQSADIAAVLRNPEVTHYVLAAVAEDMPTNETIELYTQLKNEFNAQPTLVITKLFTSPVSSNERDDVLKSVKDENMKEFIEFLRFKLSMQEKQIQRMRELTNDIYGIPVTVNSLKGQDNVEAVAKCLEEPWTSMS